MGSPICTLTGKHIGGYDIRVHVGTQTRVMISDWSSDDPANPGRHLIHGWPLGPDNVKGAYREYHMSELSLTRGTVKVTPPQRWRPHPVNIDETYDRLKQTIFHNEHAERERQRTFEQLVEARARELHEGLLSQERPDARAVRL